MISEGQKAIDFKVEDINGNVIDLSSYQEHSVLLSFFRYASCPFCNLRINELINHYSWFKEVDVKIIAIFQSPKESILEYVTDKQEVPFPIIADPSRSIYNLYEVYSSRWGYFKGFLRILLLTKAFRKGFRPGKVEGIRTLIPADFIIEGSVIKKVYYGKNITDHMPIEEIEKYFSKSKHEEKK
ncbi:MAG: redoxin domain-containing protein [Candidatus Hodarchaeales archaeon]